MITIKMCGGLGNQLFQYAYGYQMAKKIETGIALDLSWYDLQNMRTPKILDFDISYDIIQHVWSENIAVRLINKPIVNRSFRMLGVGKSNIGGYHYLKETRYRYLPSVAMYCKDNSYIDGYWQCPRYFDHERESLISLFRTDSLSSEVISIGDRLKAENSVAIHVRCGDYRKKKRIISRLQRISEDYYQHAINRMLDLLPSEPIFYVFSNDMDEAVQMLKPMLVEKMRVIDDAKTDIDEWYLMSCCQNQIIGNSTFSWWAAYLNQKHGKVVCAPNKYMGNDDILPESWISIPVE